MINHQLELGTKIYYVRENNNVLNRKKIFMTDEHGVEWYRYDMPNKTQSSKEYTVVGRVLMNIEGNVRNLEEHEDVYYLDDGIEIYASGINEFDNVFGYFLDTEEALGWLAERKKQSDLLERS